MIEEALVLYQITIFQKMSLPCCIPTSHKLTCPTSMLSQGLAITSVLNLGPYDEYEVVPHYSFNCTLLVAYKVK